MKNNRSSNTTGLTLEKQLDSEEINTQTKKVIEGCNEWTGCKCWIKSEFIKY